MRAGTPRRHPRTEVGDARLPGFCLAGHARVSNRAGSAGWSRWRRTAGLVWTSMYTLSLFVLVTGWYFDDLKGHGCTSYIITIRDIRDRREFVHHD